jgi:hypothetical protein
MITSKRNHWWDWLKIVAAWAMLCDHLRFVWPEMLPLFWLGRIAFPIFGVIAASNFSASKHREKYILKLLAFGSLSEIPFQLLTGSVGNILLLFAFTFAAVRPALHFAENSPAGKNRVVLTIGVLGHLWMFPMFGAAVCVYGFAGAVPLAIWCFCQSSASRAIGGALMNPFPFGFVSSLAACLPVNINTCLPVNKIPPAPNLGRNCLWWFYPVHLSALVICRDFIAF